MSDPDALQELATVPVIKLNIGDTKFRRRIKQAGFETIDELFSVSKDELKLRLPGDWMDILDLKDAFEKDSAAFARRALQEREIDAEKVERTIAETRKLVAERRAEGKGFGGEERVVAGNYFVTSLPVKPFSDRLILFEERAKRVLDNLAEHSEAVMVFQAFEEFSTELDEIEVLFGRLFDYYGVQSRHAVQIVERYFPNIFVVYVADQARTLFDGSNLWGNLFAKLEIQDTNVHQYFKQVFVDQLEKRNMPLYARGEEVNYYFYTALLHGGLSADAWGDLWRKTLLPLAKEIAKGQYGFGGAVDGCIVLKEIKDPESKFAPRKSVINILEKAPDSTIAPLFEASLKVAEQVESAESTTSQYLLLTSYGLPDVAMQALRDFKEEVAASRSSSAGGRRKASAKLLDLPMASLQLDLAQGKVLLRWSKKQFPPEFFSCRIDYYIDGELVLSKPFSAGVGKCILDSAEIAVAPQARYDVELKLMVQDGKTGEWAEQSSLSQSFSRSKPGCFEFVQGLDGAYCLRGQNERITRRKRIAYIVKEGYRIVPGQGMQAVSAYDAEGEWGSTQIHLFDVDPGASGSIVNEATREEIAVWQENFSARIDKRCIIGETAGGLDLYGFKSCSLGTNAGLPTISIEAADGIDALESLEISCTCDGRRVSVPRRVIWQDEGGSSRAARIALLPSESSMFDWHIERCEIVVRQRSADNRVIFRYKFSVIPIQEFRLTSVDLDSKVALATYRFKSCLATLVTNAQGEAREVQGWCHYEAKTLLKDEFLHVKVKSIELDKETDAKLALAAVEVELPRRLAEIAAERPICLADALNLGPAAGNVKVKALGWRYNRAVLAMLGDNPLLYKELKNPGEHTFNVFADASIFRQGDDKPSQSMPLKLSLLYGDDISRGYARPAWTDVELLRCREGLGFGTWKLLARQDGSHVLRFDGTLLCDVHIDFKRKIGDRLIEAVDLEAGQREVVVPREVVRKIDMHKKVQMVVAPCDFFGDPQYAYASTFTFSR